MTFKAYLAGYLPDFCQSGQIFSRYSVACRLFGQISDIRSDICWTSGLPMWFDRYPLCRISGTRPRNSKLGAVHWVRMSVENNMPNGFLCHRPRTICYMETRWYWFGGSAWFFFPPNIFAFFCFLEEFFREIFLHRISSCISFLHLLCSVSIYHSSFCHSVTWNK